MSIPLPFQITLLILLLLFSPSSATEQTPLPPPQTNPLDPLLSTTQFLSPVLAHLGYHALSSTLPSLSPSPSSPFTIFAPSDSSIHSCPSCSVPHLLSEHIVPGIFSLHYLRTLAFGTKIETTRPGRCLTVTFSANNTKIYIGGVEITRPDLFNNGLFVIHGLEGFVTHLSPLSCQIERMTSLSFNPPSTQTQQSLSQLSIMRLMLTDAMLRLRLSGYNILSLALRVKFPELVTLQNMTVFTLDDAAIFSGGQAYVSSVRFHIVPNVMLTYAELEKLPVGTVLPSLEHGQGLVITTAGGGGFAVTPMRINYVRVKSPDLMHNLKIVVHGLFLPFPRIHSSSSVGFGIGRSGMDGVDGSDGEGNSGVSADVAMSPGIKSAAAAAAFGEMDDVEDHRGL